MRTFVVGDVHGQARMLRALMAQLRHQAEEGDALVFVGDYIDRGPDSRDVIDQVIALGHGGWKGPVTTLKGNHEELMLDTLLPRPRYDDQVWLANGGMETIRSYAEGKLPKRWETVLPSTHLEFFQALVSWHEDANGLYVHAGFVPGQAPDDVTDDIRLWIRDQFIESDYHWGKVVVFGHTPQYEENTDSSPHLWEWGWRPLVREEKIGIDTGAAYGGPLTAVVLPERKFFSVR